MLKKLSRDPRFDIGLFFILTGLTLLGIGFYFGKSPERAVNMNLAFGGGMLLFGVLSAALAVYSQLEEEKERRHINS